MATNQVDRALAAPVGERARQLSATDEDQWFDRKSARVTPAKHASVRSLGTARGTGSHPALGESPERRIGGTIPTAIDRAQEVIEAFGWRSRPHAQPSARLGVMGRDPVDASVVSEAMSGPEVTCAGTRQFF